MNLASLLPPLAGLNSRTDYVGFVVDQMALGQFFSSISICTCSTNSPNISKRSFISTFL